MPETAKERAAKLLSRDAKLAELAAQWKVVEDVMAGADSLRNPTYLPQHMYEHEDEYKKRLKLTPVFRETPEILQRRQGALFRQPPSIGLPARLKYMEKAATLSGLKIEDLVAKVADAAQCNGYCGILIDRRPLPPDVKAKGGEVSAAEAETRQLGQPFLAFYSGESIFEFGKDELGLTWVKLVETTELKGSWDGEARKRHKIRIVSREVIQLITIVEPKEGDPRILEDLPILHGAKDANGNAVLPFFLFQPFPAKKDGIGRPILKDPAEADAAALWVLSELCWICYCAFPILKFHTTRADDDAVEELAKDLAASRFVVLRAGNSIAGNEKEDLSYTQYDTAPLDKLKAIWEMLAGKAKEAGGRSAAAAVPVAVEQSGVSKAWSFKTGEERILFLLSLTLRAGFQWLLELAARMSAGPAKGESKETDAVSVTFPEKFDLGDNAESFETASDAAEFFAQHGINAAVAALLVKAAEAVLPNLDEKSWKEIEAEIKARASEELRAKTVLDNGLKDPKQPKDGEKPKIPTI